MGGITFSDIGGRTQRQSIIVGVAKGISANGSM